MRFAATHKLTSYLMVLAALGALAATRSTPLPVLALALVAVAGSYPWEPPHVRLERGTVAWNVATLLCFAAVVVDVIRTGRPLDDGVYFLLFLLVNKLFNRRSSRDYQQVYILTFLLLVAGTALDASWLFLLGFAAYVLFATWGLILFNLRRDMEENYLFKHSDDEQSERVEIHRILNSRRVVGPALLAATGLGAVAVLVGAALFFLVFPRVGFGLLGSHVGHPVSIAGFGSEVRLDQSGFIQPNATVVMRVSFPGGTAGVDTAALHFRGVAFEVYRHGAWSHGPDGETALAYEPWAALWVDRAAGRTARGRLAPFPGSLLQEVQLEPLDTSTIFGASRILGIRLEPRPSDGPLQMTAGRQGEFTLAHGSSLRYLVWSEPSGPSPIRLAAAPPIDRALLARYLQLPDDLPADVSDLGRRLAATAPDEYGKALAVERYLAGYRYSLDIEPTPGVSDPLEDFLFHRRTGHCEFFATAMAVLLRAGGIPTRNVDGFLGGEWNSYGQYLAVREGDAHSWVEVYFPGSGWVTFDPTPPGPPLIATTGVVATLRQLFDSVDYAFYRFVLRYDLDKQVRLVRATMDALRGHGHALRLPRWLTRLAARRGLVWLGGALLIAIAAGVAGARHRQRLRALLRRLRRGRGAPAGPTVADSVESTEVEHLYQWAMRRLARRGHPRRHPLTPREYARALAAASVPGARDVQRLVELYYASRFGRVAVPLQEVRELRHSLRSAGRPPAAAASA